MNTIVSHQQKIERLESEKRQLEIKLRQLKYQARTAERKKLTRAKIILGALILRDHAELLPRLIIKASPSDKELLRLFFPLAAKEVSSTSIQQE